MSLLQMTFVIGSTVLRVVAFVAIMLLVGRKLIPWALWKVAKTGSRELFTLFILFASIGIAFGAAVVFEVSFALGAFFAGMVLRESPTRGARRTIRFRFRTPSRCSFSWASG